MGGVASREPIKDTTEIFVILLHSSPSKSTPSIPLFPLKPLALRGIFQKFFTLSVFFVDFLHRLVLSRLGPSYTVPYLRNLLLPPSLLVPPNLAVEYILSLSQSIISCSLIASSLLSAFTTTISLIY